MVVGAGIAIATILGVKFLYDSYFMNLARLDRMDPRQRAVIIMASAGVVAFLAANLAAGYLFLRKHRSFPSLMIGILIVGFAFVLAIELARVLMLGLSFRFGFGSSLSSSLVQLLIWIPYLKYSECVANTFVR